MTGEACRVGLMASIVAAAVAAAVVLLVLVSAAVISIHERKSDIHS